MCAIIGAIYVNARHDSHVKDFNQMLYSICERSTERGRDGFGYEAASEAHRQIEKHPGNIKSLQFYNEFFTRRRGNLSFIANLRAEPTTEYVKDKREQDQQPYRLRPDGWGIVHNGTIANDKELRTHALDTNIDSAAILELLESESLKAVNFRAYNEVDFEKVFSTAVKLLKGSFAILAVHDSQPNKIYFACNYRPIWYHQDNRMVVFASARHYIPVDNPQMITPYSYGSFTITEDGEIHKRLRRLRRLAPAKALVVCSGGLDSVVSAAAAKERFESIELIHFMYGSRAEDPEIKAVMDVGERMGVKVTLFPLPIYKKGDSPLLDSDSKVAGGEAGAEFAYEWVPARNLLLLSVATAYAEANGFGTIVLGNNLEEAGAYPDNEPEFISRFNDMLPFAVADGKSINVMMPVGNMMKHEIVAYGMALGAPLDLTWSCYRAGSQHCGTCGPCFMRRTAFRINNIPEVITYLDEEQHELDSKAIP
jgi:7-cyano-7-deazaguanine synthase